MRKYDSGYKINGVEILSYSGPQTINIRCLNCEGVYSIPQRNVEKFTCNGCGSNKRVIVGPRSNREKQQMRQMQNIQKGKNLAEISTLFYKQSQYLKTGRGKNYNQSIIERIVSINKGDLNRER